MHHSEHDSALWLRQLVAGDEAVVGEFWDRYGESLRRLARSRMSRQLRQREDSDDVVQSVCRTFIRRARSGEFEIDDTERLWNLFCAITLTKVRQHTRFHFRQKRSPGREQPLSDKERGDDALHRPSAEPTPDEAAAFADQLDHLIRSLDDEESQIVQLKLDGYEHQEIADRLGCSERTVRRMLKRVKTQLQNQLDESLTDIDGA